VNGLRDELYTMSRVVSKTQAVVKEVIEERGGHGSTPAHERFLLRLCA
jgi:hypothetical protein